LARSRSSIACAGPLHAGHGRALEITLLHNFVWHLHYTWRDRFPTLNAKSAFRNGAPGDRGALAGQLLRFHLANGLVSMIGISG